MLPDAVRPEDAQEETERTPDPMPRSRRKRAPQWAMLIPAALIVLALVGLCQLSGLGNRLRPLPTLTPTATTAPTVTSLPTLTATLTATPTAEPTITPTPVPVLLPGGLAVVTGTEGQQLRLRAEPGTAQETLRILEEGTALRVLEGPQQADGYNWWKVQTDDNLVGWVAADWLVPVAP